jgi:hypothetical protein
MADQTQSQDEQQTEQPLVPPGSIAPAEVFDSPPVELTEKQKSTIRTLVQKVQQRDLAAWREEIIDAWQQRLFDRGHQHLLWSNSFGWTLPAPGSGYHPTDAGSRSMFEGNIFSSYEEMIIGALSREFPSTRFEPNDEHNDVDITAADAAERLKSSVERNLGSHVFIRDIDRLLCTDGRVVLEANYTLDAQRFGYEPEPEGVVPEDETIPVAAEGAATSPESGAQPDEGEPEGMGEGGPATPQGAVQRKPRGRETIDIHGALEAKLPMKAGSIAECDYLQTNKEIPISVARAKFPEVAKSITAATAGPGGDNIARLARVNVKLGIDNNFVTSDSAAYDVTEQRTWFRPSIFYDPDVPEGEREEWLDLFPYGMRVVYMGETFCEARNLSLDDHVTLIHARAGDGMHRASLLKWLLPIQKVFNNLLDLANDYLTRGIPMKWFPEGPFSREKIANQTNVPGGFDFYQADPGAFPEGIRNAIFVEEILPFPDQLVAVLQWLPNDMAQMLTGCFPALFGGDSGSQGVGDALMQRDQALGRLGPVWGRIKEGIANSMRQAVQCLARSGQDTIRTVGKESVRVETADLKGNIFCFPETDENFPTTWLQKQARLEQVVELAVSNPMFLQVVDDPSNLEVLKNAFELEGLSIPQLDSFEAQLGEVAVLLKAQPLPNPKFVQAQQQLQELRMQAPPTPEGQQMIQQLQQAVGQITPEVSSVEIDPKVDDNVIHRLTCLGVLRSEKGRSLKNGTQQDKMAYANLRLHMLEHEALIPQNLLQPGAAQRPVSLSANLKDMPPKEAAQAMLKAGIQATPEDFEAQDVQQAAEKHPTTPVPVVPPSGTIQ